MTQRRSSNFDGSSLSADDIDRIVRLARARRAAALGVAIGRLGMAIATILQRLDRAVAQGRRLRALAFLDNRRLAAMGLTRDTVPASVFGWPIDAPETPAAPPPVASNENIVPAPDRAAA